MTGPAVPHDPQGGAGRPAPGAVDWDDLRRRARAMTERSYAPYSGVRVGAAALADDGRVVEGCNVENASTGIGICAEVNLAGQLVASGGGRLVALAVVAGDGEPIPPCGRCRKFLYEFGGDALVIAGRDGLLTLGELLPHFADFASGRQPGTDQWVRGGPRRGGGPGGNLDPRGFAGEVLPRQPRPGKRLPRRMPTHRSLPLRAWRAT